MFYLRNDLLQRKFSASTFSVLLLHILCFLFYIPTKPTYTPGIYIKLSLRLKVAQNKSWNTCLVYDASRGTTLSAPLAWTYAYISVWLPGKSPDPPYSANDIIQAELVVHVFTEGHGTFNLKLICILFALNVSAKTLNGEPGSFNWFYVYDSLVLMI